MNILQAIILSIVEGISEFLPISSTGHLILASHLLGLSETEFQKSFDIIIQSGAILAVVVLYFKKVWNDRSSWGRITAAFIPTGIIGLIAYHAIKTNLLGNTNIVVATLLIGGILMLILEYWFAKHPATEPIKNLSYPKAAAIGLYQTLSMIPGFSRSTATIYGGMLVGISRVDAVEFSFLLAVPTMAAATGLDLLKVGTRFTSHEFLLLGVGFVGSFIVAAIAVKTFLTYVQHHSMKVFAWYRIALALLFWLFVK